MKTTYGVYLDIGESDYCYNFKGITFYFSSQQYMKKFKDTVENYIEIETLKIQNKYKVDLMLTMYLAVSYYKKIETRGFRCYLNNEQINDIKFVAQIL